MRETIEQEITMRKFIFTKGTVEIPVEHSARVSQKHYIKTAALGDIRSEGHVGVEAFCFKSGRKKADAAAR
jgi:hypothetical protein